MIFCIGNGKSRENIDLHFLKKKGIIYGSNALYRDFVPDHLVATDPDMVNEIIKSGYAEENVVWTTEYCMFKQEKLNETKDIPNKYKVRIIPFEMVHPVNSGHISIRLAWKQHPEQQIYMIGFDLFGERKNIYDGTDNYPLNETRKSRFIYDNSGMTESDIFTHMIKKYYDQEDERIGMFWLLKEELCTGIRLTRVIDDDSKIENIDNITTEQFLEEIEWQ